MHPTLTGSELGLSHLLMATTSGTENKKKNRMKIKFQMCWQNYIVQNKKKYTTWWLVIKYIRTIINIIFRNNPRKKFYNSY